MAEKPSLNQKIAKLDEEVEWFYSDDFKLDQAVEKYKAASKLAKEIEKELENLKNEIEVLGQDFTKQNKNNNFNKILAFLAKV